MCSSCHKQGVGWDPCFEGVLMEVGSEGEKRFEEGRKVNGRVVLIQ